jgi:hypothetical protein
MAATFLLDLQRRRGAGYDGCDLWPRASQINAPMKYRIALIACVAHSAPRSITPFDGSRSAGMPVPVPGPP